MSPAFTGAALALSVVALIFLLYPLLRDVADRGRSQSRRQINATIHRDRIRELEQDLENGTLSREQFDAAVADLDRDLVQSGAIDPDEAPTASMPRARRGVVIAITSVSAAAIPILALAIYGGLGDQRAFSEQQTPQAPEEQEASAPGQPQQHDTEEIEQMAEQLRQRLEANPDDPNGWVLYGRTMVYMENLEEAQNAFEQALERGADDNPDLLAEYADILAANTGNLRGEPEEYLERALELDPENVRARWLAGTAAYNDGDYGRAREHWQKILEVVPQDSQEAQVIQSNLEQLPSGEG
ncbi:MAG: c-type cytochrome biogenesis protein CcmI [Halorhodospira sp.]